MAPLARFFTVLAFPFGLLNTFGGVVAAIWLAVLGEWQILGIGVLALMVSGSAVAFALAPAMLSKVRAAVLLHQGKKILGRIFGLLSTLYVVAIITGWCIGVLLFFSSRADTTSILPITLWSYIIATWPVTRLGRRDLRSGDEYGMITAWFVQVGYVLIIFVMRVFGVSFLEVTMLFATLITLGMLAQYRAMYLDSGDSILN